MLKHEDCEGRKRVGSVSARWSRVKTQEAKKKRLRRSSKGCWVWNREEASLWGSLAQCHCLAQRCADRAEALDAGVRRRALEAMVLLEPLLGRVDFEAVPDEAERMLAVLLRSSRVLEEAALDLVKLCQRTPG